MTIATAIRDKLVGPRVLRLEDMTEAGHIHGEPLYRYHGKVYSLTGWNEDMDPHGSGLVVSRPHIERDGDRELETGRRYARLVPVNESALAILEERARARAARDEKRKAPRLADALAGLPALAARSDRVVGTGYAAGRPAPHGPAGILALLASRGVEVSAAGDHLIVKAPRGVVTTDLREVIDVARPLLLAHVKGEPLACALEHKGKAPAAVSLLVGGAPVCEEHLSS